MNIAAMRFHSSRQPAAAVGLSEAIATGLAADGGLFVPQALPRLNPADFAADASLAATAARLLTPFFAGDPLAAALPAICEEAFDFPAPHRLLRRAETTPSRVLELFHGPTAAFKDFGARFLANCLRRLPRSDGRPLTILVATSGDTGAAVGAAFHRQAGLEVAILYPDGLVSPRQAHQLGSFGGNVQALRVAGRFDDCQRMVKAALNDEALKARRPLSSANSISLGRLLPQMAYYAHAALAHWHAQGEPLNLIVPTGNLGNALAAIWVRLCGLPVGEVRLACNANPTLPEYFAGNDYRPREALATLANAMDVGAPSNFERLCWSYPDPAQLRAQVQAESVDDAQIRATIARHAQAQGELFCPHTATALALLDRWRERGDQRDWTVVATAHPAKFESIVEPLVGHPVAVPPALAAMLARPAQAQLLASTPAALAAWLQRVPGTHRRERF